MVKITNDHGEATNYAGRLTAEKRVDTQTVNPTDKTNLTVTEEGFSTMEKVQQIAHIYDGILVRDADAINQLSDKFREADVAVTNQLTGVFNRQNDNHEY